MTQGPTAGAAAPVAATDRLFELDVLRGVALFGVLLMNIVGFAWTDVMATRQQLLSLPTAAIDGAVHELLQCLVAGKAYTIFAFLFGLGFWVQLQRIGTRGGDFEAVYLRRLTVLFVFGVLHNLFIWAWDILHLYALGGFLLYALRKCRDRTLLVGGIALAVLTMPVYEVLSEFTGLSDWYGPSPFSEEAVLARQAASESGSYLDLPRAMFELSIVEYLLTGTILAWLGWSLGRHMLGAWVGRKGWLHNAAAYLPGFRRTMRIALPAGIVICGLGRLLVIHQGFGWFPDWGHWSFAGRMVGLFGTPVLALGYLCAIVIALQSPFWRRLFAPFADAGRMALSNYVGQSFVIGFVLFGVGPGLALAGKIGTTVVTAIAIVAFAAQVLVSRWWLARFRFGPLEWLWRAATYRQWPALRIAAA